MTWDHPRAIDPLVACGEIWRERTGIDIAWDRRSLQDFETYPLDDLARRYDLIVIDHPHIGLVAGQGCLVPFESGPPAVGPSLESYRWGGKLWALPIDAATQVQCRRPDALPDPAQSWDDVIRLARDGCVLLPLRSPHALMCVMTLSANAGWPCGGDGFFLDPEIGRSVIEQLRELASLLDPACFDMDPIAVLEILAAGGRAVCAPLIYGYIPYARDGFRPGRLAFSDIPLPGARGSALGGTGIAVSASSAAVERAQAAAAWFASAEAQSGAYTRSGGQPAHVAAWDDGTLDAECHGFFSATRRTLDSAYVRPRGAGYMSFQGRASQIVSEALRNGSAETAVTDLNNLFRHI